MGDFMSLDLNNPESSLSMFLVSVVSVVFFEAANSNRLSFALTEVSSYLTRQVQLFILFFHSLYISLSPH